MRFTDYLKKEHEKLKQFFNYIDTVARQMEEGEEVSSSFGNIVRIGEVFRNYHEALEDDLLFPRLQAGGLTEKNGPLEALRNEHLEADRYMKDLLSFFDEAQLKKEKSGVPEIPELIRAYIHLMLAHTGKEEMVVFPIADSLLSPQDEEELKAKAKEELEKMNNCLSQLYKENLERLRIELEESDFQREEMRFLWNLMHDDPQTVLSEMNSE